MLPEKAGDWLSGDNIINHLFNQQLFSFNSKIKKKKKEIFDSIFCSSKCKKSLHHLLLLFRKTWVFQHSSTLGIFKILIAFLANEKVPFSFFLSLISYSFITWKYASRFVERSSTVQKKKKSKD